MRGYTLLGGVAVVLLFVAATAAYRTSSVEMTPLASSTITAGYGGLYTRSSDGRPRLVSSTGTEYRAGTASDVILSAGAPGGAVLGSCWVDSTDAHRLWCKESAGNLRQRFDGGSPGTFGCTTPAPGCFSTITLGGAPTEALFTRTCTITSAAAATPINCLSNADVPSTKRAYVMGWRAKVNGATAWATTTQCWIQDTAGAANYFVTMPVAALTANAFVADHSAGVTQQAAYSLNQGTALDLGIEIACDANGTGSNLVVTVHGVIK